MVCIILLYEAMSRLTEGSDNYMKQLRTCSIVKSVFNCAIKYVCIGAWVCVWVRVCVCVCVSACMHACVCNLILENRLKFHIWYFNKYLFQNIITSVVFLC